MTHSNAGYDRLARFYRWLELLLFQNRLWRARLALVNTLHDQLPDSPRVLVLGDGDGRFLAYLCAALPTATFTSVDQSAEMVRLQRSRITGKDAVRVQWIHADATKQNEVDFPVGAHDLLVAAFFLDCFSAETLERCVPTWIQSLKPTGLFYWVDFAQPRSGWQYYRARIYLGLMHSFFRCATGLGNSQLVDIDSILDRQPIERIVCQSTDHGLMETRLYRRK